MTPKIARFLAEQQPATPCLVLDVDRVEDNFRALQRALPLARIYYAVKANPARADPGAAGPARLPLRCGELRRGEACLDAGARPRRSASATPSRRRSAIRAAFARGVCAVRLRFGRGAGEAGAPTRRARGSIAASWWRTKARTGRCRANSAPRWRHAKRADAARRRDGAGPVRPVVPCRQPADHDARLRGGDRQGGDAVHRPDRGGRQSAHDQSRRRLPGALQRRRAGDRSVRRRDHDGDDQTFRQRPAARW